MFHALAIAYDPTTRRCDLVVQGGALVIDRTAATPLLLAIGTDARAEPDDELPDGTTEGTLMAGFNARRGFAGDRLATDGARAGSRLWLLARAKLGDFDPLAGGPGADTLLRAEDYATQATARFPARYGADVAVAATRLATNAMLLEVRAAGQALRVRQGFP